MGGRFFVGRGRAREITPFEERRCDAHRREVEAERLR
jgi:hypothetical protein